MRKEIIQKIVRLGIFLAFGIVLNMIESLIPSLISFPGVKLGLANTMGLIVLYYYSLKEYVLLGGLRVFLVGLLRSGLGSPSFLLSFSGWLISSFMVFLIYLFHKASIYGLSMTSALFHQVGQILMAMILYGLAIINYLPILLISGLISGFLIAFLSSKILLLCNRIFKVKNAHIF